MLSGWHGCRWNAQYRLAIRLIIALELNFSGKNPVVAQSLDELVGQWTSRDATENGARLEIRPNSDTVDSVFGNGRIFPTVEWSANYVIVYSNNRKCYYHLSLPTTTRSWAYNRSLLARVLKSNVCAETSFAARIAAPQ